MNFSAGRMGQGARRNNSCALKQLRRKCGGWGLDRTKFQSCKVSRFQCFKVSELQSFKVGSTGRCSEAPRKSWEGEPGRDPRILRCENFDKACLCCHPELRHFAIRSGEGLGLQKQNSRFLARPRLRLRTARNDKAEKKLIGTDGQQAELSSLAVEPEVTMTLN